MLVYIESASGDFMLSGKKRSPAQLRRMMLWTLNQYGQASFTRMFCYHYRFVVYPVDKDVPYDYWFDLDTGHLIAPPVSV